MGETKGLYCILMGKPEENRPLGRPKLKWEYNIKLDLKEREWEIMEWFHLAQQGFRKIQWISD